MSTGSIAPRQPAIYARISDDREGEAKGVARQLADCRDLVKRRGWPEPVEYVDNGVSAWKRGVVRPEYQAMLDEIEAGTIDAVVVYDLDRLYRRPIELEEFAIIAEEAGVSELTAVTGNIDLAGNGMLTARMKGAFAAEESNAKSRRIKRKAQEQAQHGKANRGGTRPFGFEADHVTIRKAEAKFIREAAGRVLAGEAVRAVCVDFNRRDVTTSTGGQWTPQVMTRMLKSARISGERSHKGEIVAKAEWPGIISAEDGRRLRAILNDPARRKNHRATRYLLAGKLTCGHCGANLVSRPREDGVRRYVCAKRPGSDACGRLAIVADDLEELISEAVLQVVEGPDLLRALAYRSGEREDDYQRAIDEDAEQLEELARAYADKLITMPELLAARGPIQDRMDKAKAALGRCTGAGAVTQYVGQGSALRNAWAGLSLSRKRAIIDAVLDHVEIGPGRRGLNRFDPARVSPSWRI